jgi:acetylornithine deacetylase/succinyl-diaminopimelate desuccinylase-like protein
MRRLHPFLLLTGVLLYTTSCSTSKVSAKEETKKTSVLTHNYRPEGDQTVHIDMAKIKSEELKKVYANIDEHFDEHVERLQKWIRQPSISNSGEGIQESAEMVKGFFDELGCQQSKVYDTGVTEWGLPGNPVVYAKCDEGAPKTVVIYWQYDTMPVTQPDNWKVPPFEARIIPDQGFKKVLVARGAANSKGPEMAVYNALMSVRQVRGKLPVNVIFVAEGDEERMDIGLRNFVRDHQDLFKGADSMISEGGTVGGGSEGCVYIQLTTSGKAWGRGPVESDIHGSNKRSVDSPAWRHIKMLSSLVSDDGNTPLIKGWKDDWVPPTPEALARLHKRADKQDLKEMAANLGVARYIADNPFDVLRMQTTETSFNMDGIWGGNMYADAAGAILPNKITSKHNIRYVPNMNGMDLVKKIRAQLDRNGYKDVELKVIGDVPWSISDPNNDLNKAGERMFSAFGAESRGALFAKANHLPDVEEVGGYWPSYLFNNGKVGQRVAPLVHMEIGGGAVGKAGRSHAANEFYVIEGAGTTYGFAGHEKSIATLLYNYAGLN